jgi:hypothetical protein
MADGGVINVVSLRRRKICGVFMLFCIELSSVYISALLPAAVGTNPPLL